MPDAAQLGSLPELGRVRVPAEWLDLNGHVNVQHYLSMYNLTSDTMLELLEYRTPPSDTERPLLSHCRGATHVAFQVDDIAAAKAELEARGVEFYSDVNVVDDGVLAGWRWVYFADPDGYPLELVENAYERPGGHAEGIARYLENRGR